ncbi:hypothetical protein TB1_027716 [Malus domestica]
MAWFRAVSSVAKLAIRRNLSNCGSYMARRWVLPSQNRDFHTTLCNSKAQSAPIPRPVPLSRLNDSFLDGTSTVYLERLQRIRGIGKPSQIVLMSPGTISLGIL